MKNFIAKKISSRSIATLVMVGCMGIGAISSSLVQAQPMQLNFKDADIDTIIGAFGRILPGKTFVVDPRVRGKISLETPRAVQPAEAYQLLLAALRAQGFTIVESGSIAKVVPEADAKLQAGPVSVGPAQSSRTDAIVTHIFRLNYESASNLVPILRPLITANNTITAVPGSNSLVVTDYAANVQRIGRIIANLDSPSTNEVEVVMVKNSVASDIAVMVSRLLDDTQRGGAVDPGQRVLVYADPRLNAIMIRASSQAKMNLAKGLIARMDQPNTNQGNVNVVYLRNAEAVKMAEVLRSTLQSGGDAGSVAARAAPASAATPQSGTTATSAAAPLANASASPVIFSAGGATIAADPGTNSLVITAPDAIYRNLRSVIDRLDVRRVQVYLETLIVEITSENAAEFGIQWQNFTQSKGGKTSVFSGSSNAAGGIVNATVNPAANAAAALSGGLNIGVLRTKPGDTLTSLLTSGSPLPLAALIKALETQSRVNILSTPNLLAVDNEQARITIGQNIPIVTGQFAQNGNNGGNANPFQTIERKDVGITLKIRPQVGEGGTIRMQFFLESSSISSVERSEGIVTNVRAIENSVIAEDGQILVLGGLIEDRATGDKEAVPGVSSVPFFGHLFRSESRRREKTNLLVFMRPVVLRSADSLDAVTADRYDYMRQIQGNLPIPNHWLLGKTNAPQLPPIAPGSISPAIREQQGAPIQNGPTVTPTQGDSADQRKAETIQVAPNEAIVRLPPPVAEPKK